jgi:hypothetical protein
MKDRTAAVGRSGAVLESIEELSKVINTAHGAYARARGTAKELAAKANLDDDVSEYEAVISGFTPLVARAVGHTGVLTEQDVQSVRKMFPNPGDSESVRNRKVARIKKIMSSMGAPAEAAPEESPAATTPLSTPTTSTTPSETPQQRVARLLEASRRRREGQ